MKITGVALASVATLAGIGPAAAFVPSTRAPKLGLSSRITNGVSAGVSDGKRTASGSEASLFAKDWSDAAVPARPPNRRTASGASAPLGVGASFLDAMTGGSSAPAKSAKPKPSVTGSGAPLGAGASFLDAMAGGGATTPTPASSANYKPPSAGPGASASSPLGAGASFLDAMAGGKAAAPATSAKPTPSSAGFGNVPPAPGAFPGSDGKPLGGSAIRGTAVGSQVGVPANKNPFAGSGGFQDRTPASSMNRGASASAAPAASFASTPKAGAPANNNPFGSSGGFQDRTPASSMNRGASAPAAPAASFASTPKAGAPANNNPLGSSGGFQDRTPVSSMNRGAYAPAATAAPSAPMGERDASEYSPFRDSVVRGAAVPSQAGSPLNENPFAGSEGFRDRTSLSSMNPGASAPIAAAALSAPTPKAFPVNENPFAGSEGFRDRTSLSMNRGAYAAAPSAPMGERAASEYSPQQVPAKNYALDPFAGSEGFREKKIGQSFARSAAAGYQTPDVDPFAGTEGFRERTRRPAGRENGGMRRLQPVVNENPFDGSEGFRDGRTRDPWRGYGKPLGEW